MATFYMTPGKADYCGIVKQKNKTGIAFVVLKPTQGSDFFFSVPKLGRAATKNVLFALST